MPGIDSIEFKMPGIGELTKQQLLRVPSYQRSYAWSRPHVNDLMDDIGGAIQAGNSDYFLGTVVLKQNEDGTCDVVDGQQRLATFQLLVSAICDYLRETNEIERADLIAAEYIATTDVMTLEKQARLTLNDIDNPLFDQIAVQSVPLDKVTTSRTSHTLLHTAKATLNERVRSIAVSSGSRATDELLVWIEYFKKSVKVISVTVASHSNAFVIFETLNDRGLDLAISDLLKNYLFSKSGRRLDEVQARWLGMLAIIESLPDDLTVTFIRHYWSSLYGLTREKVLYEEIRSSVGNPIQVMEFMGDIERSAKFYVGLMNPSSAVWRSYPPSVRKLLSIFASLRVEQVRPLLLAIALHFNAENTAKAFRFVLSCVVRVIVVGVRGGTYEKLYSRIASKVSNGEITGSTALSIAMKDEVPSDSAFESSFASMSVSKAYLARYYLGSIEEHINTGNREWVLSNDESHVDLEHVLPQTLLDGWGVFDRDEQRGYRHRLGNQTLVDATDNSMMGSEDYNVKAPILATSSLEITKQLSQAGEWDQEAINSHQVWLASHAKYVWPLSTSPPRRAKKKAAKKITKKRLAK